MYLFSIFLTLVALFLVVATTCFIISERLGIFFFIFSNRDTADHEMTGSQRFLGAHIIWQRG